MHAAVLKPAVWLVVAAALLQSVVDAGSAFHIDLSGASIGGAVAVTNVKDFSSTKMTIDNVNITDSVTISRVENTTLAVSMTNLKTDKVTIDNVVDGFVDTLEVKDLTVNNLKVSDMWATYFRSLVVTEIVCDGTFNISHVGCVEKVWLNNIDAGKLVLFGEEVTELDWCVVVSSNIGALL